MTELRWLLNGGKKTLQYRAAIIKHIDTWGRPSIEWAPWQDVPTVEQQMQFPFLNEGTSND